MFGTLNAKLEFLNRPVPLSTFTLSRNGVKVKIQLLGLVY